MIDKIIKVAVIGTNGLPANYGGFETMVNHLTLNSGTDIEYTVYCSAPNYKNKQEKYNNASLIYLPLKANGWQSLFYDIWSIIKSLVHHDVLLVLGAPSALIFPLTKIFSNKPIIINFGGLEWKRDKFSFFKRRYLKFVEKLAVYYADCLVVDNAYFASYVRRTYNKDATLIEYGGDHVLHPKIAQEDLKKYPFLLEKYAISVSRAQADNNLHLLLQAFSEVPEHKLVLISNWNKFDYGRLLKQKYSSFENLFLIDAIYDQREIDLLRSHASVYIHSHTYCGTAPSLVEAMNLGLPIIAFSNDTNPETTEKKAVFFSDTKELVTVLKSLHQDELDENKWEMFEIAKRRYTWKRIVDLYENKYRELFKKSQLQ